MEGLAIEAPETRQRQQIGLHQNSYVPDAFARNASVTRVGGRDGQSIAADASSYARFGPTEAEHWGKRHGSSACTRDRCWLWPCAGRAEAPPPRFPPR